MFLLSLLSLTLFVVPIFVTFGAYFGVEYQKILSCGFHCGYPGGGSSLGTPGGTDLVGVQYCQLAYAVTPSPGDYVCTYFAVQHAPEESEELTRRVFQSIPTSGVIMGTEPSV